MKIDVQFVNFPKSDFMRGIVAHRIQNCFDKFSTQATSIKAFFRMDGLEHHVKIAVKAANLTACIDASATNTAQSIEKALQKLESFLRRSVSKQKHKKFSYAPSIEAQEILYRGKRNHYDQENVFDKYEKSYVKDFDYM